MVDPTYPLYPVLSFTGFILALIPLGWHLEAWNSATCFFMMWTAIACLNGFVNAVVWAQDAIDHAPVWCDISIRLTISASVGIPAASMCISQRLYSIAKAQAVMITPTEKRRAVLIDTLICVVMPLVIVALSYIVQGHRYNILEELGCFPALYNTLLTYFLVNWWPLLFGLAASVYGALSLLAFNARRMQFNELLASRTSSLTLSRYFRLMALSATSLLLTIPIASYGIYLNVTTQPLGPWRSWSDTHFDFGRIEQVPAIVWRTSHEAVVVHELDRWLAPACSFIFFIYFGVASEARRHYNATFRPVLGKLLRKPTLTREMDALRSSSNAPPLSKYASTSDTLPPYEHTKPSGLGVSGSSSSTPSLSDDKVFSSYKGFASTPSLTAVSSPPTPIYNHFMRWNGGTHSVRPTSYLSCSLPLSPAPTSRSPTGSVFGCASDQSARSLSFSEIESAYGAQVSSFASLDVQHSSEPPTPLPFPRTAA